MTPLIDLEGMQCAIGDSNARSPGRDPTVTIAVLAGSTRLEGHDRFNRIWFLRVLINLSVSDDLSSKTRRLM